MYANQCYSNLVEFNAIKTILSQPSPSQPSKFLTWTMQPEEGDPVSGAIVSSLWPFWARPLEIFRSSAPLPMNTTTLRFPFYFEL